MVAENIAESTNLKNHQVDTYLTKPTSTYFNIINLETGYNLRILRFNPSIISFFPAYWDKLK